MRVESMRLKVTALACQRGHKAIFSGIGFSVGAGEALLLLGPNGAGKSSLLRIIAGLLRPLAGQIVLEGGDHDRTIAEQAHYLGHQDALKPSLSLVENLGFWTQFLGAEPGLEPLKALEAVGLTELADLPAGYLSAGQRRRLSLARLICARRPLWLLDEPSSALDTNGQERLSSLMHAHLGAAGIILAATHAPLGLAQAQELRLGRAEPAGLDSLAAGTAMAPSP
jgi:heme exporter protein A